MPPSTIWGSVMFGYLPTEARNRSSNRVIILWVIVAFDTAGEVLHALVRCIGIVVISDRDSEVYHASPDADRTHPT
jgi:hypothetical protein